MGVAVLGPLEVEGAANLEPRDRAALAVLAVRHGETVTPAQFADALWVDRPPPSWRKQVQICVGRLRRVLGPEAIVTTPGGYRLVLGDDELDLLRFERFVERGRELAALGEHDRAAATYQRAKALWRGPPLDDLDGWSHAQSEIARLEELRRSLDEEWAAVRLDAGEAREVAALAEALVTEEPLRERRWATLALAQYRCSRQVDALRSITRARHALGELGIEPGPELVELEAAILRQDPSLTAVAVAPEPSEVCPYKGLAPYDEGDSSAFFGRDAEIAACVAKLRAASLLVVAGPSGCGKSSLVRAGLVPVVRRSGRDVVVVSPGADPSGLIADAANSDGGAVWVIDQFEELFTLNSPTVVREFCQMIVERVRQHPPVVLVIRSDHLGGFSVDGELSSLVESGLHLVSTLNGDALREAIEQPARLAGFRLEHGLVDLLVRDCEGEPGALPLLSHALAETWRRRDGTTLTVEGYESSGGIRAAVARSADRLYDSLPAHERDVLRSILLRLVTPTLDGDPVRCRVTSRSILGDPSRERIVGLMVRARLVITERDTFEIAHEALARVWPRLRSWLDDDTAGQRVLRHLVSAADGWDSLGRPDSELYRGARLETALEWRSHTSLPQLTTIESEFLDASVAHAESERRALLAFAQRESSRNRRLRRLTVLLACVLVVSLVAGVAALRSSRQADRARRVASASGLAAAATANISTDPERSVLLALEAVDEARPLGGRVLRRAEEALHEALSTSRILWSEAGTGGAVDWSPDGRHVATEASEGSGRIDIRDADTGHIVRSLDAPGQDVTGFRFSPDGATLAATYRDGSIRLLDPTNGDERMLVAGNGTLATHPQFDPDGSLLAVAWPGIHRLALFDVATGTMLVDHGGFGAATAASWSPDGSRLAVASDDRPVASVIDVDSGDEVQQLVGHLGALADIAWSPDGRSIATAGDDGSARVFSAASGAEQIVIPGHGAAVHAVDWSPDSTVLATAGADGNVVLWLLLEGGGRELVTLTGDHLHGGVADPAFSPDGAQLIVGGRSGTTSMWDVGIGAGSEIATLPAPAFVMGTAVFSADGARLYASYPGGQVGVWDTASWELTGRLRARGATVSAATPAPGSPEDLVVLAPSPHDDLLAVITEGSMSGGVEGRVEVHDVASGAVVLDLQVGSHAVDAHWSPDGAVLAIAGRGSGEGFVRVVARDGTTVADLALGDAFAKIAGFDSDGDSLVVAVEAPIGLYAPGVGRVEVWDWQTATLERTLEVEPYAAAMSPISDLVAVGPGDSVPDQSLSVWDIRSGERVATLEGHTGSPNDLTFSADGRRLAVAGTDGRTRIWNAMTGELELTLGGHIAIVSSVSFRQDGTQLATTAADGQVRIWSLDLDTLVRIAQQRVTRSLTDAECRQYFDGAACQRR